MIKPLGTKYEEYLGDESKMSGNGSSISFPETIDEVVRVVIEMKKNSTPITVQGGRTGICGGAVPLRGHVLNLSYLNKVLGLYKTDDGYTIKVCGGLMLSELEQQLYKKSFDTSNWKDDSISTLDTFKKDKSYFWPPNPTEDSATIGGILATNAQGICKYLYGGTKQYVEEICLIDSNGCEMTIPRGKYKVRDKQCILPNNEIVFVDTDVLKLPKDLDLIDLYLGSEGMYGIIVSATLRLIKKPLEMWGIGFFFEAEDNLFKFAKELIHIEDKESASYIAAIEYIDKITLDNIQELKKVTTKLNELPDIDSKYIGMIYLELHGNNQSGIENIAEKLMELSEKQNCDEESTWALSGEYEIKKLRSFRHAAPESINISLEKSKQLDNRIMKLSTDITIIGKNFGDIVTMYRMDAADKDIKIAIFGHIANNHVHVNILPKNYEEYVIGKNLVEKWAKNVSSEDSIIFSEHGIGKVKKQLFKHVTNIKILDNIKKIKKTLDSNNIFNPGNMMDE